MCGVLLGAGEGGSGATARGLLPAARGSGGPAAPCGRGSPAEPTFPVGRCSLLRARARSLGTNAPPGLPQSLLEREESKQPVEGARPRLHPLTSDPLPGEGVRGPAGARPARGLGSRFFCLRRVCGGSHSEVTCSEPGHGNSGEFTGVRSGGERPCPGVTVLGRQGLHSWPGQWPGQPPGSAREAKAAEAGLFFPKPERSLGAGAEPALPAPRRTAAAALRAWASGTVHENRGSFQSRSKAQKKLPGKGRCPRHCRFAELVGERALARGRDRLRADSRVVSFSPFHLFGFLE